MPAINGSKQARVEGVEFEFLPLDLYSSLDGLDLLKGAFAPGLELLASQKDLLDAELSDVAPALGALLRGIAADDVKKLTELFLGSTFVNGKAVNKADLELMCRGKLPLYFGWLGAAIKAEYGDFFDWLRSATSGVLGRRPEAQKSPDTLPESGPSPASRKQAMGR